MSAEIKAICALCKHFKMKDYPQHAAVGIGRCHGYDGDPFTKLKNPFIPWGMKKCARFAQDWASTVKRIAWVEKQFAERNNHAAQPEAKEWDGKRHQAASSITKES